ncbi:ABC transporter permease [Cytobacillus solani]|uniref:ABC transporter permease n=1 Tax=Cytobacillus solani TaxID=1637975 RepID=A0A0Q3QTB8_9BACI|nr:ABC transporter permease [Cytobacillus solani]KOP71947.1 ABC transporter permease [Bacillus sp. FJAT-21945]KQL21393.1 ABC transporter permease [Cytobacillus solani]USK54691.1 ABC transporter permease [Cytobacillus solani]
MIAQTEKSPNKIFNKSVLSSYGTIIAGILIIIIFSVLSPSSFATVDNFINITRQISLLVVIAVGATLVMSVNEFDLSIGAIASLGGVVSAKLATEGVPIILCILIPVLVGFLVGLINGSIITHFNVLSFVTTLAMGTVIGGFTFWFTGGSTIFENIPQGFKWIGQTGIAGIPMLSIIMLVLVLVFWFLMTQMSVGRRFYAIGGNEKASKVSGIPIKKYKTFAFALCGMLAALTGALLASRLGSAHPTGGDGYFLNAYAAVFLGMTVVRSGIPNIFGTLFGAAVLGILANGLTILEIPTFLQNVITGMIIIIALIIQKLGRENT